MKKTLAAVKLVTKTQKHDDYSYYYSILNPIVNQFFEKTNKTSFATPSI